MFTQLQNSNLVAAGSTAVQFYKQNVSSTVVTSGQSYIVMVSNWDTLNNLYGIYLASPATFDANLISLGQQLGSYDKALLQTFAGAINVYSNSGSSSFYPIALDSNNNFITPCP